MGAPQKKRCSGYEAWTRRIHRFPPILVRLLARDEHGYPLTTTEIAKRSGLFPAEVETLSRETSWNPIPMGRFLLFCRACNMDMLNAVQMKKAERYLNGRKINGVRQPAPWLFLKSDRAWETYYKPLMALYIEHLRQQLLSSQQQKP